MKQKKLLIAGGNSTLLVWGCPSSEKNQVIKNYLGNVEQIGFVEEKNDLPFLNMMGGELCINGTIALASQSGKKGKLYTSGLLSPVMFVNNNRQTTIGLTLPYKKIENIILFEGIGFIYLEKEKKDFKKYLSTLANKYSLPAFGAILFKNDQLVPYVYVQQTDSLFKETACGSGSIALSIIKKIQTITQPTGEKIEVNKNGNSFILTAQVTPLERSTYER